MNYPLLIQIKKNKDVEIENSTRSFYSEGLYKISKGSNELEKIDQRTFYEFKELGSDEISFSFLEDMSKIKKQFKKEEQVVEGELNDFIEEQLHPIINDKKEINIPSLPKEINKFIDKLEKGYNFHKNINKLFSGDMISIGHFINKEKNSEIINIFYDQRRNKFSYIGNIYGMKKIINEIINYEVNKDIIEINKPYWN